MIIKGKSRSGPNQLARHLLRSDTNELVKVLELQSPIGDLRETLRDWQVLADGTLGSHGLYHANIDPDAKYTMTEEQWLRSVDRLEAELGLTGQPRAVVLHEKHGRQHIHVVWQRTDIDTMTLVSDSHNYAAHERASFALEQEFGHEFVPGKTVKRDRELQSDLPKAAVTHAEWQQAERLGLDIKAFRAKITDIYERSDTPQALIAGLNDAGLVVAIGDRRDYVMVDGAGGVFSLAREINGVNTKELRAFMADADATAIPSIAEAKQLQQARKTQDASVQQNPDPPAPLVPNTAPPQIPEAPEPAPTPEDPPPADSSSAEIERLKAALQQRHQQELQKYREWHEVERTQLDHVLGGEADERVAALDARQRDEIDKFHADRAAERQGFAGFLAALRARFNPAEAARERQEQEADRAALFDRLAEERKGELALIASQKTEQMDDLAERHAQQLRIAESRYTTEVERHLTDRAEAERALQRLEEQQRLDAERLQNRPPGLDPPRPTR